MSGYYPDGCNQTDHDRAFEELGPSPAELAAEADSQNDQEWQDRIDYRDCPHCEGSGDMVVLDEVVLDERRGSEPLIRYLPCPHCDGRGRNLETH